MVFRRGAYMVRNHAIPELKAFCLTDEKREKNRIQVVNA